jgi:hypothetical protein
MDLQTWGFLRVVEMIADGADGDCTVYGVVAGGPLTVQPFSSAGAESMRRFACAALLATFDSSTIKTTWSLHWHTGTNHTGACLKARP